MKLRSSILHGITWGAFAAIAARASAFSVAIFLANKLGPTAFGHVALLLLVTEFLFLISEAGLSSALIQRENITLRQLQTLYSIEVLLSFVIFGAAVIIAPFMVNSLADGYLELALILILMSIPIEASTRLVASRLQKDLNFKNVYLVEVCRDLARPSATVCLLLYDFGILSVSLGYSFGSLVSTAMLSVIGYRKKLFPGFGLYLHDTAPLIRFALYRFGTVFLNRLAQRADQLVITTFLSASDLGNYRLAVQLTATPLLIIQSIAVRIGFSVFSAEQSNRTKVLKSFTTMILLKIAICAPLAAFIAIEADAIILTLLDQTWLGAIPIVWCLSVFYFLRIFEGASVPLVNGLGHSKRLFYWSIFSMACYTVATILAAQWGSPVWVAGAAAAVQFLLLAAFYWSILRAIFADALWSSFAKTLPTIGVTGATAVFTQLAYHLLGLGQGVWALCFACVAFIVTYSLLSVYWNKPAVEIFSNALRPR